MKKKLKAPPTPIVIPAKPREINEIISYKINKDDNNLVLEYDYKYYVRIICLNISKFFVLNYQTLSACFDLLIKNNIHDFNSIYKEAEELKGPRQSFLYSLDKVMYENLNNFKKNYFVKYNLEFDGWWFWCDNCIQWTCCDTIIDSVKKTRTHICEQCKIKNNTFLC